MKNLRRWGLIVGGAAFVALVAGSWWVSRAQAFPGPELPSLRSKPLLREMFFVSDSSSAAKILPDLEEDSSIRRVRFYDFGLDFDAAVADLQRDFPSPGAEAGGEDDRGWRWAEDASDLSRGWEASLMDRLRGAAFPKGHVVLMLDSWRPRTRLDDVSAWVRDRLSRER